jgi:3D (Asp-Asp-Asp) domain-containing protein
MRLINTLSKRNIVRMLLTICILTLLGGSTYVVVSRFGSINSQLQHGIAAGGAETMSGIRKTSGGTSSEERTGVFTAYTSRPRETGRHPYTTADQTNLKEQRSCVVANNRLKPGTKIQIEGIGTCEIHDRVGRSRGTNHFDIYMGNDVQGAKQFGTRRLQYSVVEGPNRGG